LYSYCWFRSRSARTGVLEMYLDHIRHKVEVQFSSGCASHIRRRQKQLPIGADSFLAAAGTGSHHRTAPSAASGSMQGEGADSSPLLPLLPPQPDGAEQLLLSLPSVAPAALRSRPS
jgi:hypothetical protein